MADKYLFIVGEFEWSFDDFLTAYQKAVSLNRDLRRLRIREDGSTTVMVLWTRATANASFTP
jgi:hypothetical protein